MGWENGKRIFKRRSKATKRVIRQLSQMQSRDGRGSNSNAAKAAMDDHFESIEAMQTQQRLERVKAVHQRNECGQSEFQDIKIHTQKKQKGSRTYTSDGDESQWNKEYIDDVRRFHKIIDGVLVLICGSCGCYSNPRTMKMKVFGENEGIIDSFFQPLCNGNGKCELIQEAVVTCDDNDRAKLKRVPFCQACWTSLNRREVPRYSRASGFCLGDIPEELSCLNSMEAKMIGLGICFTTCYTFGYGGQDFSSGNAINYWNDAYDIVSKLPRPLKKCGVIRMKSFNDGGNAQLFSIRPHLVKRALLWLMKNNPLYKDVQVSEEVLTSLRETRSDIPSVLVYDEEGETDFVHRENVNDFLDGDQGNPSERATNIQSSDDTPEPSTGDQNRNIQPDTHAITKSQFTVGEPDCIESFELRLEDGNTDVEMDKLLKSLQNIESRQTTTTTMHPECNLKRLTKPINEYKAKYLMQLCFPTLFPDGCGGLHSLQGDESRLHEFDLADYCNHLMSWHDRRFVIHKTFKFFCVNLIQRRRVDGLVRRVPEVNLHKNGQDERLDSNDVDMLRRARCHEELHERGQKMLRSLKPYFRTVRGSGIYWSDVRDDVMSMVGNSALPDPWPTFFFTLSAADLIWPEFFRACNPAFSLDDVRALSLRDRQRFLNEFPDFCRTALLQKV